MLKTFIGEYYESWDRGWESTERICVVTANTESEALGLLLAEYPDSKAKHWTISERDTTILGNIKEL